MDLIQNNAILYIRRIRVARLLFWAALLIAMPIGLPSAAYGENFYVRPDGGDYGREDGTDWANAFDGMPSVNSGLWGVGPGLIGPGDTVFAAGGLYGKNDWEPGIGGSGEDSRLVIRRATAGNHGTDVGWDPAFDAQAHLFEVQYVVGPYDYITLDGGVYDGIKITVWDSENSDRRSIGVDLAPGNQNGSDYLILRNIEIVGPGRQKDGETRGIQDCLGNYLLLENCHIHDIGSALYIGGYKPTIQDCYIHDIDAAGAPNEVHENLLFICGGSDGVFRWNYVKDVTAVGVFTRFGGDRWKIYGNTFIRTAQAVLVDNRGGHREILVYNNTFIDCIYPVRFMEGSTGSVMNNIFYWESTHASMEPLFYVVKHDYNWFPVEHTFGEANGVAGDGEFPFLIDENEEYLLQPDSTAIDRALDLGDEYALDPIGEIRGYDGHWDIGAHEFDSDPDKEPPSIPLDLKGAAKAYNRIHLTWSKSFDNTAVLEYIIYRRDVEMARTDVTEFMDETVSADTLYSYQVKAVDLVGNESEGSASVNVRTMGIDIHPPTAPKNLKVDSVSAYHVDLSWEPSRDDQFIEGYPIFREDEFIGLSPVPFFRDSLVNPDTPYRFYVASIDSADHLSKKSEEIIAHTLPEPTLNAGLVAAYNCDETTGTVLRDYSQYGNDGLIKIKKEDPWVQGIYGWSLMLDGKHDLIEVADKPSLNLIDGMTLSAWIYPTTILDGWQHVIAKQQGSLLSFFLAANSKFNTPRTGLGINGAWVSTGGGSKLQPYIWNHVTSTYDGETLLFFVNGNEVSRKSVNAPIETSNDPLYIGGDNKGEHFQGRIDEIRIYNRPLPVEEVRALMSTPIYNAVSAVKDWIYLQ